jgi:hypothetical protein
MPGTRDLEYLVSRTREEIGIIDPSDMRVVNGYASEMQQYPDNVLSIVRMLNWALGDLRDTGFNQCRFDIVLQPELVIQEDMGEYLMPRQAHDIREAYLRAPNDKQAYVLQRSSVEEMNAFFDDSPQWTRSRSQRPIAYYMIGTRGIGFYPRPQGTGYTATFLAETLVADMVLKTDIPAQIMTDDDPPQFVESALPEGFHENLCYGAGARILRILGGDQNFKRAAVLGSEWTSAKEQIKALVNARQRGQSESFVIRTPRRFHKSGRAGGVFARGAGGPLMGGR